METNKIGCTHRYKPREHKNLWLKYCVMKRRCYSKKFIKYPDYGGRGIKICDEWLESFDNFAEWAYANGYKPGLTIERKDVNGNYCPENCTFIPIGDQAKNKRNTIWVDYEGERIQLSILCKRENVNYDMVRYRMNDMGWTAEKAIKEPSAKERVSLAEKCRQHNISRSIVKDRINKLGWNEERALTTPPRHCRRKNKITDVVQ